MLWDDDEDEEEEAEVKAEVKAEAEEKPKEKSSWEKMYDQHQIEREESDRKFKQEQEESQRKFEEEQVLQRQQSRLDQLERIENLRALNNQLEGRDEDFEGKKLKSLHLDFD